MATLEVGGDDDEDEHSSSRASGGATGDRGDLNGALESEEAVTFKIVGFPLALESLMARNFFLLLSHAARIVYTFHPDGDLMCINSCK